MGGGVKNSGGHPKMSLTFEFNPSLEYKEWSKDKFQPLAVFASWDTNFDLQSKLKDNLASPPQVKQKQI